MSSNTVKRIISALVMAFFVALCVWNGKESTRGLILFIAIIAIDELFCNIFRKKRFSFFYFLSEISFLLPYCYLNFFNSLPNVHFTLVALALLLNFLLLFYLFYIPIESETLKKISLKFSYGAGPFFLLPMISLVSILDYLEWRSFLIVLLIVAFGMDSGAWFFGKNFGSLKLWEKVSPNKTVEGLVGGMLTAGLLGYLSWFFLLNQADFRLFFLFSLLGVLSQLGDLIQSKMKRQFKVKDSSSLIPGHGGVYDRIDSLLFSAPFFVVILKFFYH